MVRLGKFFSLVHNEYIKIFKKTSTKIMLVLILLGAFAFSGFMLLILKTSSYLVDYESDFRNSIQSNIDELKQTKPEGYEKDIEIYQLVLDENMEIEDWRYSALDSIVEVPEVPDADKDKIISFVKNKDDKGYCEYKSKNAENESEKWAYEYRVQHNIGLTDEYKDQNKLIDEAENCKMSLAVTSEGNDEYNNLKDRETLALYQLEHEIYINTADYSGLSDVDVFMDSSGESNFWIAFMNVSSLVSFVGLLMIVIAGGSVSSEFSQGTIKFLLINPVKRWKILMAKYFSCITIGYIMLVITYIISIPAVGIIHGFNEMSAPYLYVKAGEVHQMSSFLFVARQFLVNSVQVVVMATMAFAISSLVRSSALAIGVSVFAMFAGNTITGILSQLKQDWARYLVFSNVDLLGISQGNSLFPQQTVGFAVCVLAAHMVVFLLTAWDGFTKKSV